MIDCPSADLDESPSEVITVNMPLHHEVIQFQSLSCKYSKRGTTSSSKEKPLDEQEGPGLFIISVDLEDGILAFLIFEME